MYKILSILLLVVVVATMLHDVNKTFSWVFLAVGMFVTGLYANKVEDSKGNNP